MAAPVLGLASRSRMQGGPEAWGRGAVGQSDRARFFALRQRLFRCGDPRGRRVLVPPLPSALPKFPGNFTAGCPRHHRWPRGGVYAEDRSGSSSNKTSQPHGQLLRLSGRRRTEPQFFHSSPGERAASFILRFAHVFCKSRAPVPPALTAASCAMSRFFEGRSRCEKQRIPLFCVSSPQTSSFVQFWKIFTLEHGGFCLPKTHQR